MKKTFETAELDIVSLAVSDIVTISPPTEPDEGGGGE